MYIPDRHQPPCDTAMRDLIRAHPLGTLVTAFSGRLAADHIPMLLTNDCSRLQGHVASANPMVDNGVNHGDALAIFQGPQSYISPSWHSSKQQDGKVVPTWNYVTVHVHGKLKLVHDTDWLVEHLNALTEQNEGTVSETWKVSDAPRDYIDRLRGMIVGIEIRLDEMHGKWKTTVVRPEENAQGVADALSRLGNTDADGMAILIRERFGLS